MKRTTALRTAAFGFTGMLVGALSSCRGEDVEFDCSSQQEAFQAAYADDGVLLPAVTESASYPMALVLSEVGIQRLINGLVGGEVPFASELKVGPYGINFIPQGTPLVEIVRTPGCSRCVLFSLDFDFDLKAEDGDPAGTGVGQAQLAIPLKLVQNPDGTSDLVAAYDAATVKKMPLNTQNIDTEDYPGLEGALSILATKALREQYESTPLMHFEPWTIGGNEVKLVADEFNVFYDSRVLSLAMQTNLDLPRGVAVEVGQKIAVEGIPMQVQMHPGLLLAMAQRMITEGAISRTYNDQGKPDPKGLYGVTLETLAPSNIPGTNQLDVGFRVWRTQEGYCGYADAETTLIMKLDPMTGAIQVVPGDDLRVTGGEGVGELAKDNEELIAKNKQLVDVFKKDLSEQVGITLNYNEVGVEGSTIIFDADALQVERNNINILIDFEVYASEDGE